MEAFEVDKATRLVSYESNKCVACGLCLNICPMRALEMKV
ncbi:4Fe-4S binding protein [Chloroflexota bacterium]